MLNRIRDSIVVETRTYEHQFEKQAPRTNIGLDPDDIVQWDGPQCARARREIADAIVRLQSAMKARSAGAK